jgi:polygalacturonase
VRRANPFAGFRLPVLLLTALAWLVPAVPLPAAEYFVATDGADAADGSYAAPWATVNHALARVAPGDVINVRGGVYRQQVLWDPATGAKGGAPGQPVTLRSAPGEAAAFLLSRSFSATTDWVPAGDGLWATAPGTASGYDAGCVWHDDLPSEKKWTRDELHDTWDFWFDADQHRVFVRAPANPATLARHIEIPTGAWMQHVVQLRNVAHVVVSGLTIKYSNTHGIQMTAVQDVTIRGCRISHGGGAWIWTDHTRFGNGVELWCDGSDVTVEDCDIAWIFDTGITNQGDTGNQARITYRRNRISHTKCGLEHWATGPANVRDVLYEANTITDSGDNWARNLQNVWGGIRLMRHHPNGKGADTPNTGTVANFVVRQNLIERCGSPTGAQQPPARPFAEHPGLRIIGGNFTVEDNVIRDSRAAGLYASRQFEGVIRRNRIEHSAGPGLQVEDVSPRAVVADNQVTSP